MSTRPQAIIHEILMYLLRLAWSLLSRGQKRRISQPSAKDIVSRYVF
jgi:hypothetical protein